MIRKLLITLMLFGVFTFGAEVTAYIGDFIDNENGNVSFNVYVDHTAELTEIYGFEFDLLSDGVLTITNAEGGFGELGGAMISFNDFKVIGFSLTGTFLEVADNQLLVSLEATYEVGTEGTILIYAENSGDNKLLFAGPDASSLDGEWIPSAWEVGVGLDIQELFLTSYTLGANYPNPFNPTTNISYSIPAYGEVSLIIFDATGREVSTLVAGEFAPGAYNSVWNGTDYNGNEVSTGMYFYKLTSGDFTQTRKMLFVK